MTEHDERRRDAAAAYADACVRHADARRLYDEAFVAEHNLTSWPVLPQHESLIPICVERTDDARRTFVEACIAKAEAFIEYSDALSSHTRPTSAVTKGQAP